MLAEIITRAAAKPWPQYIQERIFAPLGMNATHTTTVEGLVPHRASAYYFDRADNKFHNGETWLALRPSGAFISSVLDLAKWDAALYTNKPFSLQQRELMWTPVKLPDGVGVLVAESEARFFDEDDTRFTYAFARGKDGRMQLVGENEEGKEVQRWTKQDQ